MKDFGQLLMVITGTNAIVLDVIPPELTVSVRAPPLHSSWVVCRETAAPR